MSGWSAAGIIPEWEKALSQLVNQNPVHDCIARIIIIFYYYVKCLYFDYVSKINILEIRNAF